MKKATEAKETREDFYYRCLSQTGPEPTPEQRRKGKEFLVPIIKRVNERAKKEGYKQLPLID